METMKVMLEDGPEEERPFTLEPGLRSREIGWPGTRQMIQVPVTYPGERAEPVLGGWGIFKRRGRQ
jgi:hypothetical protein